MKRNKRGFAFIYFISISLSFLLLITTPLEAATLSIGSGSGMPGDTNILIPTNLTSSGGEEVSGFGFDLTFDISRLSFKGVSLGPKATEAGKSLSSSQPSPDSVRVMVIGFNQTVIGDGVVLNFTFDILSSAPAGESALALSNLSITDPDGGLLPASGVNGGITVEGNPTTTPSTTNPTTINTTSTATTSILGPDTTTSTTSTADLSTSSTSTTETTSSITSTSSSTVTPAPQLWPLLYDEMWGGRKEENLFLLRAYRDEILANTEMGREYIFMLYSNSLEIVMLLFQTPQITEQAGKVINDILPAIQYLLYQDNMVLNKATIDEFESLLNQVEPKSSFELKAVIKRIKEDLKEEEIFRQLGITVVE